MSARLWALIVDVETHWGFSLTYFASTKSGTALRIVPPTTIIGALSYPLAKLKGWPENAATSISSADRLRGMLRGVYYSMVSGALIQHAEITKVVSFKVRERKIISDAVAVQKTYAGPGTVLRLYYVFDVEKAWGLLKDSWKDVLARVAWSVSRLGSKESLVSVVRVDGRDVEPVELEETETRATIPLDSVERLDGRYVLAQVVDWRKTSIGSYYGAPMIAVAQPLDPLGQPPSRGVRAKLRQPVAYRVLDEYLVPWTPWRG